MNIENNSEREKSLAQLKDTLGELDSQLDTFISNVTNQQLNLLDVLRYAEVYSKYRCRAYFIAGIIFTCSAMFLAFAIVGLIK